MQKMKTEAFPRYFGYFEAHLKENGSTGYFVGNSVSILVSDNYDDGDDDGSFGYLTANSLTHTCVPVGINVAGKLINTISVNPCQRDCSCSPSFQT